ncbi:ATP-binding protein [Novosphingobium flavum]|uniref:ATP-binding protein n=1 Tax=Novosphingobium flavum TaxID=1778672 RepID=A0A7X1FRS9_9SPHN|nr:ATP-binding protein [Novosphingobium flavum]
MALTGPYGSGKSSIIKSFLKKHKPHVLQISLASFLPEATATGGQVTKQEIERSILQQMLYGADANQLPHSRFQRIKSPGRWSALLSLYAIIGLTACWHLFQNRDGILNGRYFLPLAPGNWPNFVWFAVGASFLWVTVHHLYKASFGVSLKSISLKDIQIMPTAVIQESILNRHLDEIIYFFQSTKYDLVVIEDLDRFNNTDIFVTLREINSLINENSGVKRTIRFLYALRDDMFVNTDRTKFFEFIIPVIPIINRSNSIDMMLEQGKRLSLDGRLDRQFLREVSRYLNDLRLIHNIFNEYAIYVANLETDGDNVLDANKLLAVLIYKNVFPRDFEDLHRGKGNLAQILSRHEELIANGETACKAEIERLEQLLDVAEGQVPADLMELRRIYAMALVEKLPSQATHVSINSQSWVEITSLPKSDAFEKIISNSNIRYQYYQGHQGSITIPNLQVEVDALRTYKQREKEIEHRAVEFKAATARSLREIRIKRAALRTAKFNDLIRLNADGAGEWFTAFGESAALARFLILEGHLDDTYYQYTSLFHSGRLSPNDNKYLIQIRGFVNPEPGFQIDNPKEVVAAMRDEDFRQNYVLNVKIVDCLLSDPSVYSPQISKMLEYISSQFESCDQFFLSYYATGTHVPALVAGLVQTWPGFIPATIAGPKHLSHVAQVIAHLPDRTLATLPETYPEISRFLSEHLPQILALGIDFDPSRLKILEIQMPNLQSIERFPGIARMLFEEGLYKLSVENLEFIFQTVLSASNLDALRTRHYTTVLETADDALSSRIESGFADYLSDVLLELPHNTQESVAAVQSIIGREEVDFDDRSAFLRQQTVLLPAIDEVPDRFHALVFRLGRIDPTWKNCLGFLGRETFDAESLTAFLDLAPVATALSKQDIPNGDEAHVLRRFLVDNNDLEHGIYRTYVQRLPRNFSKFPDALGPEKLTILIDEGKITFSKESLDFLEDHRHLQVRFVVRNIEQYLADQSAFSLGDEFNEGLLGQDISDQQKLAIIRSMDLALLPGVPSRAGVVGRILDRTRADTSALDAASARAVILNSGPIGVQISLLNKCQSALSDDDVREILTMLPAPFSEIKTGYSTPRIEKSDTNLALVKWLDRRDIISSWSETLFGDAIRINLYRRDSNS